MKITSNITKDFGRLLFWYPLRWIVITLPFPSLLQIARLLGRFDYLFLQKDRTRRVARAIQVAIGCASSEANGHVQQNLINHYANTLELIKYPGMNCKFLRGFVNAENRHYLDSALHHGTGVILMTAHFGAKQLLQIFLGREGYSVNQINHHVEGNVLTFIQKHVSQRLRKNIESKLPITFIAATSFHRKTLECLKNKEILIVAGDGSGVKALMDSSYRSYSFLGKNMLFPSGPEALSQRTGATIIPVFVIREGSQHRIVFEKPIWQQDSAAEIDPIQLYSKELEKMILNYPHMWDFWEEFDEGFLLAPETST